MAISQTSLPEGTDSIISGAASDEIGGNASFGSDTGFGAGSGTTTGGGASGASAKIGKAAAKVGDATSSLRAQATDKAYGYAAQGKDRAVGVLDNATRLIDDAAAQIDEKAGAQYGAYARQASQAVAGFADTLRDKDVEELFDDARELVRKSPAIAIGAAAALGFVFARLLKVGLAEGADRAAPGNAEPASRPAPTPSTATTVPVDTTY